MPAGATRRRRTESGTMPSLRDLQRSFAAAIFAEGPDDDDLSFAPGPDAPARMAIYRDAMFAHYRRVLRASYPVIARLVGTAFFNAAVDAFVRERPSTSGDLNAYGDSFGDFLQSYPHAAGLPYLADVARLEWSIDEAQRAADVAVTPEAVLAELAAFASVAPEELPRLRLDLDPSCRLLSSEYPVLRIWQANQASAADSAAIDLAQRRDTLLVRREAEGVAIAWIPPSAYAFLAALHRGEDLGTAIDAAEAVDPDFDLDATLRVHIANGIIVGVADDEPRAPG